MKSSESCVQRDLRTRKGFNPLRVLRLNLSVAAPFSC